MENTVFATCCGLAIWQFSVCVEKLNSNPQGTEISILKNFDGKLPEIVICSGEEDVLGKIEELQECGIDR